MKNSVWPWNIYQTLGISLKPFVYSGVDSHTIIHYYLYIFDAITHSFMCVCVVYVFFFFLHRSDPFMKNLALIVFLYYTSVWAIVSTLVVYVTRYLKFSSVTLGWLLSGYGLATMVSI